MSTNTRHAQLRSLIDDGGPDAECALVDFLSESPLPPFEVCVQYLLHEFRNRRLAATGESVSTNSSIEKNESYA